MSREAKLVVIYLGLFAAILACVVAQSAPLSALAGTGFGFWTFLMLTEDRP